MESCRLDWTGWSSSARHGCVRCRLVMRDQGKAAPAERCSKFFVCTSRLTIITTAEITESYLFLKSKFLNQRLIGPLERPLGAVLQNYRKGNLMQWWQTHYKYVIRHNLKSAHNREPPQERGRVEIWRGGVRFSLSVAAPFVRRCLTSLTISPFSQPAHRTGRALLTHPALGQNVMPSPTENLAEALAGGWV